MVDNRKTLCYSITRNKIKQAKSPKEKIKLTNELTLLTKGNFGGVELDSYRNEGLRLVKTEKFAGLDVDFYRNENNEVFMTRNQIGTALEYANPNDAIRLIHRKNRERLDTFSVSFKLNGTDGKAYDTTVYNEKGIYEILRKSNQPKADDFYDFVYDVIEGLRKGELTVVSNTPSYMIDDPIARAEQWITEYKEKVVLEEKIVEYTPKVKHYEDVMSSENLLTTTAIAKGIGMSARDLNATLHKLGVQFKMGNQWHLYSKYDGKGYTKSVTSLDPQGKFGTEGATHVYTKWTFKGREFIYDALRENGVIE